jgi:PleD family two-component response regulator
MIISSRKLHRISTSSPHAPQVRTASVIRMSQPSTSRDGSADAVRPRRVLVVEDDRAISDAVVRRLRSQGYRVDAVFDGPAAVSAAARTRYDVVVLDVMLPGLDGHEVCRRIRVELPPHVDHAGDGCASAGSVRPRTTSPTHHLCGESHVPEHP